LESYNTKYRTLGYGISNCIGKSAGTIAPFIFIPLYLHIEYLPFLVLGIITAITGALVTLLPSELT
jgi:VIT1/CCC1 family predicted Fe2+/Mn2+ transporter